MRGVFNPSSAIRYSPSGIAKAKWADKRGTGTESPLRKAYAPIQSQSPFLRPRLSAQGYPASGIRHPASGIRHPEVIPSLF